MLFILVYFISLCLLDLLCILFKYLFYFLLIFVNLCFKCFVQININKFFVLFKLEAILIVEFVRRESECNCHNDTRTKSRDDFK